jgi:hypothetical protein
VTVAGGETNGDSRVVLETGGWAIVSIFLSFFYVSSFSLVSFFVFVLSLSLSSYLYFSLFFLFLVVLCLIVWASGLL